MAPYDHPSARPPSWVDVVVVVDVVFDEEMLGLPFLKAEKSRFGGDFLSPSVGRDHVDGAGADAWVVIWRVAAAAAHNPAEDLKYPNGIIVGLPLSSLHKMMLAPCCRSGCKK